MNRNIKADNGMVSQRARNTVVRPCATVLTGGVSLDASTWGDPVISAGVSTAATMMTDVVINQRYGSPSADEMMALALRAEAAEELRQ